MSASTEPSGEDTELNAWNPGVQSAIPRKFLPLASLYRPENCSVSFANMQDRADLTGLELEELAVFRPERIAIHSLLIRVTANIVVSDGERYADLGINFRHIAADLEQRYVQPLLPAVRAKYEAVQEQVQRRVSERLTKILTPPVAPPAEVGFLGKWLPFLEPAKVAEPPINLDTYRQQHLQELQADTSNADNELDQFCWRALAKLLTSTATRHGRILGDADILSDIATGMAMNVLASKRIGEIIEEGFHEAVLDAGYALLPLQTRTVVINTKGASASGKSTLRPLQRALTERLDLQWRDFALISPDIWRKYLLDYDSLGDAWRYAGSLSGHELRVVDHKLDLYMATRHSKKGSPHLLIDRFRFDSFQQTVQSKGEERLLTRFGDDVFMMFMVTPPEALVERAWGRGLEVGRFKPVDDLLDHCVEAYQGMPPLFFRWAVRTDKQIHYEFLDNSIPKGEVPRTIAFGEQGQLVVLSIKGMLDISRFARIDIRAKSPPALWPDGHAYKSSDTAFLQQCAERLNWLDFALPESGIVYARFQNGQWQVSDESIFQNVMSDDVDRMAIESLGPFSPENVAKQSLNSISSSEASGTLGQWSASAP